MSLTWWGTACVLIEMGGTKFLTDPAFDPAGTRYDFGPWYTPEAWFSSTKTYDLDVDRIPWPVDAVLATHDQHADNLDYRGRAMLRDKRVTKVITTPAGARRLGQPWERNRDGQSPPLAGLGIREKVRGLEWGESVQVGSDERAVRITATPCKHGPIIAPYYDEVCGFLLEKSGFPTVWVSGDTVPFPRLTSFLSDWSKRVDVAIVHCGGVKFPDLPGLGSELYTFDAKAALAMMEILQPTWVVPVHHTGWTHFRQPLSELRSAFASSAFAARTRWPTLGKTEIIMR